MAKNYVAIFEGGNDAIALEQKFYLKEETIRGEIALPSGADFLFHTDGSVNFTQPIESSPHKTGRHHTSVIAAKTETAFNMSTLFNIDTLLGTAQVAEIDSSFALLHKSMFGDQDDTSGSPVFTAKTDPNTTFTVMEIGDVAAKQAPGTFLESANMNFPGDGDATVEWAGMSKTQLLVGMGKSVVDNNGANTIALESGHGRSFPVGAKVMLILQTNAKSADTVADTARTVTAVSGDTVTLDGAILADADGSTNPIYLVYFEPENATAINDPQTGLVGSVTLAGFPTITNCVRSLSLNCTNNHELQDFCFGETGLGGPLFVPGGRLTVEVSLEINLNQELVRYLNQVREFDGDSIDLVLGDASSRHLAISLPKTIFNVPEVTVPETGSIPVTFVGNANQSVLDAADEITLRYQ